MSSSSGYGVSSNSPNFLIVLTMITALATASCTRERVNDEESDSASLEDAGDMGSGEITEDGAATDLSDQSSSDMSGEDTADSSTADSSTADSSTADLSDGNTSDSSDGHADAGSDVTVSDMTGSDVPTATDTAPQEDRGEQDIGVSPDADLGSEDVSVADMTPDETPDAETDTVSDTSGTGDVTEDAEVAVDMEPVEDMGEIPTFDCDSVVIDSPDFIVHDTLRAYHGLAFDSEGNFYGAQNNRIYTATYGEPATPFGGIVAWMEQLEMMADGDIAACGDSAVYRVSTETGGNETLSTSGGCYGVRLGPDDMLYIGDGNNVYRIDPATGERNLYVRGDGFSPRVMDFSPDSSRMYMGTNSGTTVYYVDLNEDLEVISEPEPFRSGVGDGWMDGLAVDICGNVYVAEYYSGGMYRISPDATEMTTLFRVGASGSMYGHGIQWGSGVGGWDDHTMFIPQPYNGDSVAELYLGVPYRTWEGIVINQPPMLQNYVGETIHPAGSSYSYIDTGESLDGESWMAVDYDDSSWPVGTAPLGYGDDHFETELDFGPDDDDKHITMYFRGVFNASGYDFETAENVGLDLMCDDGCVVYLNGEEVIRANMPEGEITSDTVAITDVDDESAYKSYTIDKSLVLDGDNTLAIEAHQWDSDSSDSGFDISVLLNRLE